MIDMTQPETPEPVTKDHMDQNASRSPMLANEMRIVFDFGVTHSGKIVFVGKAIWNQDNEGEKVSFVPFRFERQDESYTADSFESLVEYLIQSFCPLFDVTKELLARLRHRLLDIQQYVVNEENEVLRETYVKEKSVLVRLPDAGSIEKEQKEAE